jgi:hypothetical protein
MPIKAARLFLRSAGMLLIITATAKLISSFGSAGILETGDPVLKIPFRILFWAVGGLEIVVGLICLLGSKWRLQTGLVAWLATMFLVYRLGLLWIGYQRLCPCLGNLTDALHLPVHYAEMAMKIILGYLLIGSYGIVIYQWWNGRKLAVGRTKMGNQSLELGAGG